ncbi:MAG: endolytic transglycosylase MltG [Myxococcales bacterium]|nr:endolytic transglycosylase MltG [Myxococcales bacterium]
MKRLLARLALVLVLAVFAGGAYAWHRLGWLDRPLSTEGGLQAVEIPPGASFRAIVARLHDAGVVTDPLVFEWYGRYRGVGSKLKAGTYAIDLRDTPRELLAALERGTLPAQVRITIPEGFNRWQIADLLAERGLADRQAFLERVERDNLEGRLFPDTYWIREGASLDEVVRVLTDRFDAVFDELIRGLPGSARLREDGDARQRLLTLASLVEKEARTDRDRGLVARVFENRLARGMKLQTDPTCVYSERLYREVPHPRYCKDPDNRYSTYVIDGLPPGPIANPGRAALAAALRPTRSAEAEKLLYFVARRDGTGEHHFSETHDEHRRAVQRFLVDRETATAEAR